MSNRPQRIWRIAHSEASLGWGGQEHRVYAELKGFQKRGHPVWLLAPESARVYGRAKEAGIGVEPIRRKKLSFMLEAMRISSWLKREKIDVLNTHSSADGWLVGIAGRMAKVPLLIRSRHIDVSYPNRWLSKHAFTTLADHVLTTSQKITAHFQSTFQLSDDRITTLPTGIDVQSFQPDGPKSALITGSGSQNIPAVAMISVLRSWKGHDTFLDAIKRLQAEGFAARYFIVGDGPQQPLLTEKIKNAGLSGVIQLCGHREDVADILRALDVLVIASTQHEGVPQIGLQALASKTAVVGSDVGGTPEIIREGETGRNFPAGNGEALAKAIKETIRQKDQTRLYVENGRRLVEKEHSIEVMLDKLESLYRRYLA
jgi:glycosyltransferase involved in cell wall biosynthesis